MSKFLLLMPIWLGVLIFLLLRALKVKSIPLIAAIVSAGIVIGGVFSFVYADMSMNTPNYFGISFADLGIKDDDSTPKNRSKYDPPAKTNTKSNRSSWGTDFWVTYRKNIK